MNPASGRRSALHSILSLGLCELGLEPVAERCERLLVFIELLQRWNRAYNLTAVTDPQEMVTRHLLDSLAVAPWLTGQRILDLGSGAGLPAIPLAVWFPEREFHLLDSNGKKIRFLFQAKTTLELHNVSVHQARAEEFRDPAGFDCITSRAFASLGEMIRVSAHLLAPGGCFLAMKGRLAPDELAGVVSPYTVASLIDLDIPGLDAERRLVRIVQQDPNAS